MNSMAIAMRSLQDSLAHNFPVIVGDSEATIGCRVGIEANHCQHLAKDLWRRRRLFLYCYRAPKVGVCARPHCMAHPPTPLQCCGATEQWHSANSAEQARSESEN